MTESGLVEVCLHCRRTREEGHLADCAVVRIPDSRGDPFAVLGPTCPHCQHGMALIWACQDEHPIIWREADPASCGLRVATRNLEPTGDADVDRVRAFIVEGRSLTLYQAVAELLQSADETMRGSGERPRPPDAHGGAYLARYRFERLREAWLAVHKRFYYGSPPEVAR